MQEREEKEKEGIYNLPAAPTSLTGHWISVAVTEVASVPPWAMSSFQKIHTATVSEYTSNEPEMVIVWPGAAPDVTDLWGESMPQIHMERERE